MNNEQEKLNTTPEETAQLEAEFAARRKVRVRRTRIIRAVVISVLSAVLVAMVYLAVHYRDRLTPESLRQYVNVSSGNSLNTLGGAADVVGGNSSVYAAFENGLAVATTTSVRYATPDGRGGFSHAAVITKPSLRVSGEYLLAYDRGGSALMLFDKNGLISSGEAVGNVISASVSEEGIVSVISEAEGYISCLTVYSEKFQLVYRWYNSEYYCIASAYHDDSQKVGVSVVMEREGSLGGRFLIFDVTAEGIAHSVELGHAVPTDVYVSDLGFTVATRTGADFTDVNGSLCVSRDFAEPLQGICPDGQGGMFFLLAPFSPDEKYSLIHADSQGVLSGTVTLNEDILSIHASFGRLAILTGRDAVIYNTALDVERIISTEPDIINIAVIRRGTAVLFSEDGLTLN